jgi:hypothetical protein
VAAQGLHLLKLGERCAVRWICKVVVDYRLHLVCGVFRCDDSVDYRVIVPYPCVKLYALVAA